MNEYWEMPAEDQPELEFEESGRPGCLSVFAVMLAAGGIGYGIVFGILGLNLMVGEGRPALGALVTISAIPLAFVPAVVAVGLWRMRTWAWWLTVIFGSLGLGAASLSFVAAFLGADPMRALGFVMGPLMGLMVGVVVLAWFLRNRERFGQEAVVAEGERAGQASEENALVIFAVTVMGCMTLICLVGAALAAVFLFGFSLPFFR